MQLNDPMGKSEQGADPYDIWDLDNSCGDSDCCGGFWPQYYIWLAGRQKWWGSFDTCEEAEAAVRRLERWGVK